MRLAAYAAASLIAIGILQSATAYAQSTDSVVMRRSLDPKTRTFAWVPGEWSQCSNSCGAGQRTRSVQCMMNGKHGTPEVNCGSARPADTEACYDVQGCSYTWQPGEWTDVAGCGQVIETRKLTCLRGDGQTVSNDQCPAPTPDTSREVRDLRTCSYGWKQSEWSAFSGECQTGAVSTRTVWCERSNGEKVSDAECSGSGAKPEASRTENRYGQCGYTWRSGDWSDWSSSCQTGATRTRTVECLRSNGDVVPDGMCSETKPAVTETSDQYGKCSYSWKEQEWGQVLPGCGTSSRSRTVQCVRSNGDVVAEGSCDAGTKPAVTEPAFDDRTCSYDWNAQPWGSPSNTCGQATFVRAVNCRSSDGRFVAESYCKTAKPDGTKSEYVTTGCGYEWSAGAYGAPVPACGPTVQNRSVTCLRSDGQTVADASCDPAKRPVAQQGATDYSTCTYGWTSTSWGSWSSSCGQATQTRTVTCQSSDGRTVSDSFCVAGSKPAASQSAYQTSGCGYTWQSGGYGNPTPACGASVQYRDVWCLRSDGVRMDAQSEALCGAGRPVSQQAATDYGTCSYSWSAGGWSALSTTCGAATQTRSVTCVRSDGTTVADASCSAGTKPAASQSSYQISSCSYARVNPTAWSAWDNACSGSANRTRTYQCQRQDGAIVGGTECTSRGISLIDTETGANYTNACPGYFSTSGWSDYNSHCSASATRTRTVACYRSGDNVFAGDQYCTDRGLAVPARSETTGVYDGCGYEWQYGGWGAPVAACGASTQYRAVWCRRTDGTTVADGYCNGGTRPASAQGVADYTACSYGWAYNGWGTTSQTCGSVSQARSVWCQRSDGATVADGYCGGGRPAASQTFADYSACGYSGGDYVGSSDWNSHCSASATRTNYYNCKRSDGVVVDNAECTNRGIALTHVQSGAVYDQCTYAISGWGPYNYASSCSGSTTATQYATGCRRQDGTLVDISECSNRGIATSQSIQTSNLSGCGYSWQTGGFGGFSSCSASCGGGSQTQYRDVWCQRTDGARVDASLCGAGQPSASNSQSCNTQSCAPVYAEVASNNCTVEPQGWCTGTVTSKKTLSSNKADLKTFCSSVGAACCTWTLGMNAQGVMMALGHAYSGGYSTGARRPTNSDQYGMCAQAGSLGGWSIVNRQ